MVISLLYIDVITVLFYLVLLLVILVLVLIAVDFRNRRDVVSIVSPNYIISDYNRKGKLPMSEAELLKIKNIISAEKKVVEQQKKKNEQLLRGMRGETQKQKEIKRKLEVGIVGIEKKKQILENDIREEVKRLEQKRRHDRELLVNSHKKWHEEIDAHPKLGRELIEELKKKNRK